MPINLQGQSWITYAIWSALLVLAAWALVQGRWPLVFVSLATFALSLAPLIFAATFSIQLPLPFLAATTLFIFASVFLGEALNFYERFWWWDLALHGSSAIGFGLIGFLFVLMLFEGDKFAAPAPALAFIAFCFAVTIGACWEIFEFTMDQLFGLNMQKSGLPDTMGDLIIDVCGALIASASGWLYVAGREHHFPAHLIAEFVRLNRHLYRKSREKLSRRDP